MLTNFFLNKIKKRTSRSSEMSPSFRSNYDIAEKIYQFFYNQNYTWIESKCFCSQNTIKSYDENISKYDRDGISFKLVICKNCGTIRAKKYLTHEFLIDFYKNYYRQASIIMNPTTHNEEFIKNNFLRRKLLSKNDKWSFIFNHVDQNLLTKDFIVADYGGRDGADLAVVSDKCRCILLEYDKQYFYLAKENNIETVEIGSDKSSLKSLPKLNLLILSHVVEHMPNLLEDLASIRNNLCDENTLIYIEFPGVDTLKFGRKSYDFHNDIHVAHYSYLTTYGFVDIMERCGFECIEINDFSDLNPHTQGIFRKSNVFKKEITNYYERTLNDLKIAEMKRFFLFHQIKNILRNVIPNFLWKILKKYLKKSYF
jgi:hypothetical protein